MESSLVINRQKVTAYWEKIFIAVKKHKIFFINFLLIFCKIIVFEQIIFTDEAINPLYFFFGCSWITLLLSFGFLFRKISRELYFIFINFFITLILIIDIIYFKVFAKFPSIASLKEINLLENLSLGVWSLIDIRAIFFAIDIIVLLVFVIKSRKNIIAYKRDIKLFSALFIIFSAYIIPFFATKSTDICDVSGYIYFETPLSYHFSDIYVNSTEEKSIKLDSQKQAEIKAWYENNKESLPDNKYKAMFKGKNIIFLQVESLESFVIQKSVNNQEITPTINKLLNNSLYFSNTYEQINEGSSSDADLLVNTSIYPIRNGSTFYYYPFNTYNSLPKLLEEMGYSTLESHAVNRDFWNLGDAMTSIGFQNIIYDKYFNSEEFFGIGISDGSYLKQMVPILHKQKQPFYAEVVTASSHMPFKLPQKYRELKLSRELDDSHLGGYFQSIHYVDKQIGIFMDNLKEQGLLDNTIVVIYGDHDGIHKYYKNSIPKIEGCESWWLENNNRDPFIVYNCDYKGETIDTIGGQIDIFPTIAYLVGINEREYSNTAMGRNLLKTNKSFAVLSNGKYVGTSSSKKEKEHNIKGLDIADIIIRSSYYGSYRKQR